MGHAQRLQGQHRARGDKPAVRGPSGRHRPWRAVRPGVPGHQPEQQDPRHHRPGRTGRQPDRAVRVGRDPVVSRAQDRPADAGRRSRPGFGARVADVSDGRPGPHAGPGASFPALRARAASLRDRPLHGGKRAAVRRVGPTVGDSPVPGRRVQHRRHRRLPRGCGVTSDMASVSRTIRTCNAGTTRSPRARP